MANPYLHPVAPAKIRGIYYYICCVLCMSEVSFRNFENAWLGQRKDE
jgi:hypothetical protein